MMSNKKAPNLEEEAAEAVETAAQEAAEGTTEETAAPAAPVEDAADDLQARYDDLNDRFLRMAAEYENFRKRSQRERDSVHADAVAYAVKALLPTVDNLERALKAETADAEYKKGVEMTFQQLLEALKGLGVTPVEAAPGAAFDPNLHDAVMHVEDEAFGENEIAEVFQQGFAIGGKVIRHAMVKVAN